MEQADNTTDHAHQTWLVYRRDDHGNRFVVTSGWSRRAAEQLVTLYEQRGHKQHYWAEDKKDESRGIARAMTSLANSDLKDSV